MVFNILTVKYTVTLYSITNSLALAWGNEHVKSGHLFMIELNVYNGKHFCFLIFMLLYFFKF